MKIPITKKTYIIGILIVLVLVLLIVNPTIYTKILPQGNSALNNFNESYAAIQGDYIYYVNYSDNYKLYKENVKSKEKTKLSDNECSNINIIGNDIFYIATVNKGRGNLQRSILKIDTDGKIETIIDDSNLNYNGLIALGDKLYFSGFDVEKQEGGIFRMSINGGEKELFINDNKSDIGRFTMHKNELYYYCSSRVFGISFSGSTNKKHINSLFSQSLGKETIGNFLAVDKDNITYISTKDGLAKTKDYFIWKEQQVFSKEKGSIEFVENDWVYFLSYEPNSTDNKLKKINKYGGEAITLTGGHIENIHNLGAYIYFKNWKDNGKIYRIKKDGTEFEIVD